MPRGSAAEATLTRATSLRRLEASVISLTPKWLTQTLPTGSMTLPLMRLRRMKHSRIGSWPQAQRAGAPSLATAS